MSTVPLISLSLIPLGLYLLAAILQWFNLTRKHHLSKFMLFFAFGLITLLPAYLLYRWLNTPEGQNLYHHSLPIFFHILISIVAFGLLCLALIQALLLFLQNHLIRQKNMGSITQWLPPLQTMEKHLFQMIGLGFIFLTASVITAVLNNHNDSLWMGSHVQKLIISILAWIFFAFFLFYRYRFGLRGSKAIQWTLCGFVFTLYLFFYFR